MFNRKIILLCVFLSSMCLFSGCESAPETNKEKLKESVELDTEKYVSIQKAKEQCEQLEGQNIDGIVFPEKIEMPEIEKIIDLKLTPWFADDRKDLQQVLQDVWQDYHKVDWEEIKQETFTRKEDKEYYGESKEDKVTGYIYSFDTQGFMCGDSLNDTELTYADCVKEYHFSTEDSLGLDDKYLLEDGEVTVGDAVLYAEKVLNENLSELEKNKFQYKVQHLYVMKNTESGFCDYNMVIGRVYQNIAIDTCSDFLASQAIYYDKVHCGVHMIAIMRHKESLDYVNVGNELFEIESETKHEKIISPMWATKKMNEEIAHADGMTFSQCGLVYVLVQDNGLVKEKQQDVFQSVNETTYLRPVWLFVTTQRSSNYETLTNDGHGVSVIVDALDGELYYYEGTGAY